MKPTVKVGYYKPLQDDDREAIEAALRAQGATKIYREQTAKLKKATRQSREYMLGRTAEAALVVFTPSRDHAATDREDFAVLCAMLHERGGRLVVAGQEVSLADGIAEGGLSRRELAERVAMEWGHVRYRYANRGGKGGKKCALPPQNIPAILPPKDDKDAYIAALEKQVGATKWGFFQKPETIAAVRDFKEQGFTTTEIAAAYGVATNTVLRLLRAA